MDFQPSPSAKIEDCDQLFPSAGTIGHLAILDGFLLDSAAFTVNAATDTLTFNTPNKLATGSRIRITATTTIPGGLLSGTDYFTIKISTTQFKLASTLVNAIAGTVVNITDAGSGLLQAFEQALNQDIDGLGAMVAHELVNVAYTERFAIEDIGPAVMVNGDAQKNPWVKVVTNSSSGSIISSNRLLIRGGSASIGDISGSSFRLHQEEITIYSGETKAFTVIFMR